MPEELLTAFSDNDYVYTTIRLKDLQIRKNLYWFSLPYESAADIVGFVKDE